MKVLKPLDIYSSSRLTSSTIAQPDLTQSEAAWNSGTTYALNAQAIDTATRRKYQSLQASNTNHPVPNYLVGETENAWWLDVGPTNKYAMFDYNRNTRSIGDGDITVVLTPGERINALAILSVVGISAHVSATSVIGGGTVYDETHELRSRDGIDSWYDYFFTPFTAVPSLHITDIPPYSDVVITITIDNGSTDAECGAVIMGWATYIGDVEFGAISGALNFSTVERNEYGDVTLIPRRSVPKTTQRVWVDPELINAITQLREELNATVALWIGLEDSSHPGSETFLIFGFYRNWEINYSSPDIIQQDIEIEEV